MMKKKLTSPTMRFVAYLPDALLTHISEPGREKSVSMTITREGIALIE